MGSMPQAVAQETVSQEVSLNIGSKPGLSVHLPHKTQNRTNISSQLSTSQSDFGFASQSGLDFTSQLGSDFELQQQEFENVMVSFPLPHLILQ
jgi:hypothetical protein